MSWPPGGMALAVARSRMLVERRACEDWNAEAVAQYVDLEIDAAKWRELRIEIQDFGRDGNGYQGLYLKPDGSDGGRCTWLRGDSAHAFYSDVLQVAMVGVAQSDAGGAIGDVTIILRKRTDGDWTYRAFMVSQATTAMIYYAKGVVEAWEEFLRLESDVADSFQAGKAKVRVMGVRQ